MNARKIVTHEGVAYEAWPVALDGAWEGGERYVVQYKEAGLREGLTAESRRLPDDVVACVAVQAVVGAALAVEDDVVAVAAPDRVGAGPTEDGVILRAGVDREVAPKVSPAGARDREASAGQRRSAVEDRGLRAERVA